MLEVLVISRTYLCADQPRSSYDELAVLGFSSRYQGRGLELHVENQSHYAPRSNNY
jgi:hypothetical protein